MQLTANLQLSDVIAWVESRQNPRALRFEPATYARLITGQMTPAHSAIVARIARIHRCSVPTAQVIYSTSFGLYQFMGFNLYADDSVNSTDLDVFAFCDNPQEQARIFNAFVKQKTIVYTPQQLAASQDSRVNFGNTYNGDGAAYALQIAAALQNFGLQVA